jgi:hypothetical protein
MNTESIVKELIKRRILTDGTNVNADLNANGIGGYPVRVNKNVVLGDFGLRSANGFERDDAGKDWSYKVKYCDITHVEGMTVSRLAQAYKIKIK